MTRMSFLADLATARAGDKIVYHTGLLMMDRLFGPEFQNIHAIATAALDAFKEGRVHLVQKRISRGVCAYIAVKRASTLHLRKDQTPTTRAYRSLRSTPSESTIRRHKALARVTVTVNSRRKHND